MSDGISIKGIVAPNGTVHHFDHEYLDNNPNIPALDTDLDTTGEAAESKAAGNAIDKLTDKIKRTADIHYCKILVKSEGDLRTGVRPNTDGVWTEYISGTYSTLLFPCNRWDSFYQTNPRTSGGFVLDSNEKLLRIVNFNKANPVQITEEDAAYIGFSVKTSGDESYLWFTDFDHSELPNIPAADFGKLLYYFGDNVQEYVRMANVDNLQNIIVSDAETEYSNMLSNLPRNTYCHIKLSDFLDVPDNIDSNENTAIVITFSSYSGHENLNGIRTQLFISPIFGRMFTRRTSTGTSFTPWTVINNYFASEPRYYAFGDSLMWGAVWTENENHEAVISHAAWKKRMPSRIAHAIGAGNNFVNYAVGGMAFIPHSGTYETSFYDYISGLNLSDANIITLGGGRNDSPEPLGSGDNPTSGTICYEVDRILEHLTTEYPMAQIVWTQVTPSTSVYANIFEGRGSGGWSLNDFETEITKVCNKYGVPFVNWKQCQYIYHWPNYTGAAGNTAHPNNDDAYVQMGNYLAGKVSSYFKG